MVSDKVWILLANQFILPNIPHDEWNSSNKHSCCLQSILRFECFSSNLNSDLSNLLNINYHWLKAKYAVSNNDSSDITILPSLQNLFSMI